MLVIYVPLDWVRAFDGSTRSHSDRTVSIRSHLHTDIMISVTRSNLALLSLHGRTIEYRERSPRARGDINMRVRELNVY